MNIQQQVAQKAIDQGMALLNEGRPELAIERFDHAIRLDPSSAEAHCRRGTARRLEGNHAAALGDLNRAIQLDGGFAEAYWERGLAKVAEGDFAGAIVDYSEAIRLWMRSATANVDRTSAFGRSGRDGAVDTLAPLVRRNPRFAAAFFLRGLAYQSIDEHRKALDDLSKAQQLGFGAS